MLSPDYLRHLPDALVELYAQAEADILADMARRISTYDYWIPAAEHQRRALAEMGALREDILRQLSRRTGKSERELERLMEEAAEQSLGYDGDIYRSHGLAPQPLGASPELQKVLAAGLKQTKGLFKNLTGTTARTASGQFEAALDRAWMQVSSGAFDYNAAIRTAVKDLSRQGVGAIRYPTGHVDTLEVAVRRAVVTGVNQTCGRAQEALARAMGCDLMELTAHAGARPEHAAWQGQIVSLGGRRGYLSLGDIGYGSGAGFKGWNCRHDWNPYFEGSPRSYSPELLESYEARDIDYNGQKLTEYEASQQQRAIERNIRRWKRENKAMEAAGLDPSESAAKVRQWQAAQKDFLRQTGLKRQAEREQVYGAGRRTVASKTHVGKGLRNSDAFDLIDETKAGASYAKQQINKELSCLRENHRKIIDDFLDEVHIGDVDLSTTGTKTGRVILRANLTEGEFTHELGHVIAVAKDLYHDPEFLRVLRSRLPEDMGVENLIEAKTASGKLVMLLEYPNSKFVSLYQAVVRESDVDGNGVYLNGAFNPKTLREYISEGFRAFYFEPMRLMERDAELYRFLEELK